MKWVYDESMEAFWSEEDVYYNYNVRNIVINDLSIKKGISRNGHKAKNMKDNSLSARNSYGNVNNGINRLQNEDIDATQYYSGEDYDHLMFSH